MVGIPKTLSPQFFYLKKSPTFRGLFFDGFFENICFFRWNDPQQGGLKPSISIEKTCWRWEVKFGIRTAKKPCFWCGKMTIPRFHRIPSSPDFGSLPAYRSPVSRLRHLKLHHPGGKVTVILSHGEDDYFPSFHSVFFSGDPGTFSFSHSWFDTPFICFFWLDTL